MDSLQRIWLKFWDGLVARLGKGRVAKALAVLVGIYLLVTIVVGIYWSFEPDSFDGAAVAQAEAEAAGESVVVGYQTTSVLIHEMETLLNKPGGYITNDRFPPGLWLDNISHWEYGVLIQARDMARAMRKTFSRSQSQSTEDPSLVKAEPLLQSDSNFWILPSSEGQYKKALKALRAYRADLADPAQGNAQFYARADNLRDWLGDVSTRLGSLSQRLSASVGQRRLNTDLAGSPGATQSTAAADESLIKTPWLEIDDVFYEARGTAWALIHLLEAVKVDFADTLEQKSARVSLEQIIRELEATQETIWSPMILNGTEFGLLANHSLVMASYISRANAAIIDLRDLLSQG
ncbi:DUF2333 family protein [Marinobacterium mangrovicola]|uniref:DUF2333 family protein n=1 Tax=Marinobacterium mangrovicola TaxID=1476959 RepID=A0A4R1G9D5_9GAMM|nr:DUF2333 family protein [Marinobacterium mangrovicola]TCK03125.1 hypothetical protein CLV83_4184 [Marinobacterium mangrovicola]